MTADDLRGMVGRGEASPGSVWKVRNGNGFRSLTYCPPGSEVEIRKLPSRATSLEVECGVASRTSSVLRLRLEIGRDAARWEPVAEMTLEPCGEEGGCWQRSRLVLAGDASGHVRITVEPSDDDTFGPPLVGCSEVRGFSRGSHDVPRNALIIVVDTLRADRMSLYGHDRPTTPNLEAWARRGAAVFDRAYTHAPWTLPAHASLFTGFDTIHHGHNWNQPVPLAETLLAERLHREGWTTMAVTGGAYLAPAHGLLQGFARASWSQVAGEQSAGVGDDLEDGVATALGWLRSRPAEPFFLFFHTYQTHAPYLPHAPWTEQWGGAEAARTAATTQALEARPEDGFVLQQRFQVRELGSGGPFREATESDMATIGVLYDSGVAAADHGVGRILHELEALGLDERTVVFFTSDHGESLGEAGLVGHTSLDEGEIRVPLVIRAPGRVVGGGERRVRELVSLVDVVPTILELLGLPGDPDTDGRSLVPLLDGRRDPARSGESWCYAASTNRGISLRRQDGLDLRFRNDAWLSGQQRITLKGSPSTPVEIGPLRERVVRRYLAETRGFRLSFAAGQRQTLRVSLGGPDLRPVRVKSCDSQRSSPSWSSGTVSWALEPGESRYVIVEEPPDTRLVVTARVVVDGVKDEGLRETLHRGDVDRLWVWDGRRWTAADSTGRNDGSWLAATFPPRPGSSATPSVIDAETAGMLRALGYGE